MIELHYIRLRTPYHRHRSRNTTKHRFCLIILRHWWEITLVITKKNWLKKAEGTVFVGFCLNSVTNFMIPMNFEMNPTRKPHQAKKTKPIERRCLWEMCDQLIIQQKLAGRDTRKIIIGFLHIFSLLLNLALSHWERSASQFSQYFHMKHVPIV